MTDVCGNSGNDLLQYCRVDIENRQREVSQQGMSAFKTVSAIDSACKRERVERGVSFDV